MLARLSIRDVVLIDRLELAMAPGLLAVTGETGAGKSILLDAFALALGARGDGGLVRAGCDQGHVAAVFDLPADHPVRAAAAEAGIDTDGEVILRRVQMADGRTRAYVNDQAVSAQTLRQIGRMLVEIHGQHDDRALADPATHRALLDAFAGLDAEVEGLRRAHRAWRDAAERLAAQTARVEAAAREGDYLRHATAELEALAPAEGEEERLATDRQALQAAERAIADLAEALETIGGAHSPLPALLSAHRRLERRAAASPEHAGRAAESLNLALHHLEETRDLLERALRDAAFDPRDLERIEERLFALRAASRKYQTPVAGLPALAERFRADLSALDRGEQDLVELRAAAREAEAHYRALASTVSERRRRAAAELDAAVNAELPPLKLERARFLTDVAPSPDDPGPDGWDRVAFVVQTNPGTRPGPLMKVASGGELARFMLALKVSLADRGSAPTLVFDEIDSGVGGAVADAIGQRLARLSSRVQVLAVTHAPQVAARADRHLLIAKEMAPGGASVVTRVSPLETAGRREEIARMLSGATVTDEARAAAARLLAGAA